MKYAVDLHIHSALSPCGDLDMTPNNIVNMAVLKGLDIIAVTDHNAAENLPAILACAGKTELLVIPGMEVETQEEVHLVCLFPGIAEALKMQEIVYDALPGLPNREDIFGQQLVMDEQDRIVGKVEQLLVTACSLGVEDISRIVGDLGGIVIPAHIDRESYSLLSNLGGIPEGLELHSLEVSKRCGVEGLVKAHPWLSEYLLLKSSDAHYLWDILEQESFVEMEEKSVSCLFDALRGR